MTNLNWFGCDLIFSRHNDLVVDKLRPNDAVVLGLSHLYFQALPLRSLALSRVPATDMRCCLKSLLCVNLGLPAFAS